MEKISLHSKIDKLSNSELAQVYKFFENESKNAIEEEIDRFNIILDIVDHKAYENLMKYVLTIYNLSFTTYHLLLITFFILFFIID